MAGDAITGVCVVADKIRCPEGYEVIDMTTDNQDADLWKDKMLRKKTTRYLCFTKKIIPEAGNNVLVDIMVIKENESIPAGYTCIATTYDTSEPVLKKKLLVIQVINRNSTQQAISDIYLTSTKTKTKPVEVSPRGDINGINMYLRMTAIRPASIIPDTSTSTTTSTPPARKAPVPAPRQFVPNPTQTAGTQQHANSNLPYSWDTARLQRQKSTLRTSHDNRTDTHVLSAIEGVPFQISSVLKTMGSLTAMDVPRIPYKSLSEINSQYSYDFNLENQTKQRLSLCDSP